jgi:hypothetical protein
MPTKAGKHISGGVPASTSAICFLLRSVTGNVEIVTSTPLF